MFSKPPRLTTPTEKTSNLLALILAAILLASNGSLFTYRGLYVGYLLAAMLALAAILTAYLHIGGRRLKRELAHIERLEAQQHQTATAADERA